MNLESGKRRLVEQNARVTMATISCGFIETPVKDARNPRKTKRKREIKREKR